jgi:hypothetical protein
LAITRVVCPRRAAGGVSCDRAKPQPQLTRPRCHRPEGPPNLWRPWRRSQRAFPASRRS